MLCKIKSTFHKLHLYLYIITIYNLNKISKRPKRQKVGKYANISKKWKRSNM